jgi:type I restriction enzyme R subunit
MKMKDDVKDEDISAIDKEKAMLAPQRITEITKYILEHFDQKTRRDTSAYEFNKLSNINEVASDKLRNKVKEIKGKVRLTGFNSIFAVASIDMAKAYYAEFKKQMNAEGGKKLKVALIYSFGINEDTENGILIEENSDDTSNLDESSRDFLDLAIDDYNVMFKTDYDTSSDKFQNYYKDVSLRMKNREIDLLIVANMFLTGFDATTLNTLWVDKNLKYHGLLQAFSRTNRILNSIKTYGNIVCFRDLQERTEEAIALFGDKNAGSIVLLRTYNEYYNGYEDDNGKHHKGYVELIAELNEKFPLGTNIIGENNEKEFISLWGAILKMRNILTSFDEFEGNSTISARDIQDHQSNYLDLYNKWRRKEVAEKENINDDIVFEMELVRQVEVNIDYILILVAKYHASNCEDKEILVDINKAINSSIQLRSKKELIEGFIATVNTATNVDDDWNTFVAEQKEADLTNLIEEENLNKEETKRFIDNCFRDGELRTFGTAIGKILPPVPLFGAGANNRQAKQQTIVEKLSKFFEKYLGLV